MSTDPQYVLNRKAAADQEAAADERQGKAKLLARAKEIEKRRGPGAVPQHLTAEEIAWCGWVQSV